MFKILDVSKVTNVSKIYKWPVKDLQMFPSKDSNVFKDLQVFKTFTSV